MHEDKSFLLMFPLDIKSFLAYQTHVLLNKADKLSRGASKSTLLQVEKRLCKLIETGDLSVSLFSGKERTGCEDIWLKLADWFSQEWQD